MLILIIIEGFGHQGKERKKTNHPYSESVKCSELCGMCRVGKHIKVPRVKQTEAPTSTHTVIFLYLGLVDQGSWKEAATRRSEAVVKWYSLKQKEVAKINITQQECLLTTCWFNVGTDNKESKVQMYYRHIIIPVFYYFASPEALETCTV